MRKVLILGIGDVGSAIAHRLFRAGHMVAIQDQPQPTACRRQMAFADAMFDGETQLTGVIARLVGTRAVSSATWTIRFVPVTTLALGEAVRRLAAGDNVDVAIETSWENLGKILRKGPTLPFRGEPRMIGGHGRERYVYAAAAGVFSSRREIGDAVRRGEVIGKLGRRPVKAPLAGRLRGLTRPGVAVAKGTKLVEVIPAGSGEKVAGIGERPRRVAEAVLKVVRELSG
jgi:xanthine dehydrogenase accessory factor